jgi:methyl-accepting chemotaxis protein
MLQRISLPRLLQPGRALMLRLSMRAKLAVVAVCVMLPLTVLLVWWTISGHAVTRGLQHERTGLQVVQRLADLSFEVQKQRTLAHRLLAGDAAVSPLLADVNKAVLQATAAAGEAVDQSGLAPVQTAWRDLLPQLQRLQAPTTATDGAATARALWAAHGQAVATLTATLRLAAEDSTLLLDSEASGYFLTELLVTGLPPALEAASRATGLGSGLLQAGPDLHPDRGEVLTLARQLEQAVQQLQVSVSALVRSGHGQPAAWADAQSGHSAFIAQLRDTFARDQSPLPAATLAAAGGQLMQRLQDLQAEATADLMKSLDRRIGQSQARLWATAAVFAFGLMLTVYLFSALYLTFMQSIGALQVSTLAVSSGDLSAQLKMTGSDELATIGQTVNGMNERLSNLVGEIRNSAARVNMAGSQVAEGSQRLSVRTEEQASSLRDSVVAISQLSSEAQHNAQAARDLDGLTEELSRQASDGTQAMGETLVAVQKLQDASRRVFEVVAVIDDVAFQTSMLSLNAAVEAARAGEAGKGFSIVASEVRSLAQRVGESAEEIRSLITLASDQLEFSGTKLATANQSLEGLAHGVQDVSARLRQISQASTQQSDTLVSVAQRVGDLDQITRDNARLVDESTAAANSLVERAQILREAVASMRLRQGSADEARELLDRAWDHVAMVGQDQGFKDLHDKAGAFIDRDLYVFALDRDGAYIACGAKPEMIGTSVNSLPGIQGTPFVQEAWAAAEAGGGWVQYEISNPLTGEVTPKESYVRQLDDGLLLGCGVYRRTALDSPGNQRKAAAWSHKQERRDPATV